MACCECLLIGNARPPLHLTGNAGARRMQGEGTPLCPVRDNKGLLGWRQSLKGQRDKKGRDPSTANKENPHKENSNHMCINGVRGLMSV